MASSFEHIMRGLNRLRANTRLSYMAGKVAAQTPHTDQRPIIFFNASSRVSGLSLNAAFSLLTSWVVRLAGAPVMHFVCQAGMSRCVQGTNQDDVSEPMPCAACLRQSRAIYSGAQIHGFAYQEDAALAAALKNLNLDELTCYEHALTYRLLPITAPLPLGALVLPAIRWRLRIHNLQDDEATRFLYREFMLSAWNVAWEFNSLLDATEAKAAVIFNGQFFPEATACWLCRQRGVRVITHEVGLQPYSAFFADGEATAYPMDIPDDFNLSPEQNARLDAYLEKRFQGQFSMAGIRFWPDMKVLDTAFIQKAASFSQVVPVFTNVIFDTSQPHSNMVFDNMFAWLDTVFELIQSHPEALFVIRAHPDEKRPGTRKQSRETVQQWVIQREVNKLPNVIFYDSGDYASSYELIQRSKFVMVYNSSIGLEASIMGAAVLCGGRARYTQYPTVFFPLTVKAFRKQAETFLRAGKVKAPEEHRLQARRVLYYHLFVTSLPFDDFLEPGERPGLVRLKPFDLYALTPKASPAVKAVAAGILGGRPFLLDK